MSLEDFYMNQEATSDQIDEIEEDPLFPLTTEEKVVATLEVIPHC